MRPFQTLLVLISMAYIAVSATESLKISNKMGTMDAARELSKLRLKAKQGSLLSLSEDDVEAVAEQPSAEATVEAALAEEAKDTKGGDGSDATSLEWSSSFEEPSEVGEFIPFGKKVPRKDGVRYYIASGEQECSICKKIIGNAYLAGSSFYDLCAGTLPEHAAMCHTQQKALQNCPEFVNDWCYQDLGGSQKLVAPCPSHLKCHYCLGLNPLNCL